MTRVEPPRILIVSVTRACNLSCPYCFADGGAPRERELTAAEIGRVIEEAKALGVRELFLDGGEPFMRDDFLSIVARALPFYQPVVITNGTLIDDAAARALASMGLRRISVSLDGFCAEVHDVTRRGSFARAVRAVRALVEAGVRVIVDSIVLRHNVRAMPALVQLCRELGVSRLNFEAFEPFGRGRGCPELAPSLDDWRWVLDSFLPAAARERDMLMEVFLPVKAGRALGLGGDDRRIEWESCPAGEEQLAVTSDGAVLPCSNLAAFPDAAAGNVRAQPLAEIWASPRLDALRRTAPEKRCPMGLGGHLSFRSLPPGERAS